MIDESEFEIEPSAFKSNNFPDHDISVNWLEHYGDNPDLSIQKVRDDHPHRNLNEETGRFIKLKVSDIKKFGKEHDSIYFIVYKSKRANNPSHASIHPPGGASFSALALCAERHGQLLRVPQKS